MPLDLPTPSVTPPHSNIEQIRFVALTPQSPPAATRNESPDSKYQSLIESRIYIKAEQEMIKNCLDRMSQEVSNKELDENMRINLITKIKNLFRLHVKIDILNNNYYNFVDSNNLEKDQVLYLGQLMNYQITNLIFFYQLDSYLKFAERLDTLNQNLLKTLNRLEDQGQRPTNPGQ